MKEKIKIKRKNWARKNLENSARHVNLQPKYQRLNLWVTLTGMMVFTLPLLAASIYFEASYDTTFTPDSLVDWITLIVILGIGIFIFVMLLTLGMLTMWGLVTLYLWLSKQLTKQDAKDLLTKGRFPDKWFDTTFD